MSEITFTRHRLDAGETIPGVIWDQYPWPTLDAAKTIGAAGFHPEENPAVGILPEPWKGHPRNALVISPTINLSLEEFAVSNESLDSLRT